MKEREYKYIKRMKLKKVFSSLKLVSETPLINVGGMLTKYSRYARTIQ